VLRGHESTVRSATFSPDGQRVVTASDDETARVWRVDGQEEPVVLRGHGGGQVVSAAFSPNGQRVVTASDDETARVWRVDGQGEPVMLRGHEGQVVSAAFSPDGQWVVTASEDGTARLWTLSIDRVRQRLREANKDCLSVDDRMTYVGETEDQARERYEACERSYGRVPLSAASPP
jgi:WD40 repeat protein